MPTTIPRARKGTRPGSSNRGSYDRQLDHRQSRHATATRTQLVFVSLGRGLIRRLRFDHVKPLVPTFPSLPEPPQQRKRYKQSDKPKRNHSNRMLDVSSTRLKSSEGETNKVKLE